MTETAIVETVLALITISALIGVTLAFLESFFGNGR